jgi:hypothetical protein
VNTGLKDPSFPLIGSACISQSLPEARRIRRASRAAAVFAMSLFLTGMPPGGARLQAA